MQGRAGSYKHIHTSAAGVVSQPVCAGLARVPGGPGCAEPLQVEVRKNFIKCERADTTARPLRAFESCKEGLCVFTFCDGSTSYLTFFLEALTLCAIFSFIYVITIDP